MSSYNNSLSKKLDEYARLQQEHANSLYEGRESQESYKDATITASVLRSVAYALHEVCKGEIVPGSRAEEYQIKHDIVTNPDFIREVMEGVGQGDRFPDADKLDQEERYQVLFEELKRVVEAIQEEKDLSEGWDPDELWQEFVDAMPGKVKEANRAVDPDIFRKHLERLLDVLRQKGYPDEVAPTITECQKVLDRNPISPARAVQSKYEGRLEEAFRLLSDLEYSLVQIDVGEADEVPDDLRAQLSNKLNALGDILNKE